MNDSPPHRANNCVTGHTLHGKACKIVDNTASVPQAELERLLNSLIASGAFGVKGLSDSGGGITLGKPQLAHIQIGETLYRLLVYPYQAQIEHF